MAFEVELPADASPTSVAQLNALATCAPASGSGSGGEALRKEFAGRLEKLLASSSHGGRSAAAAAGLGMGQQQDPMGSAM